MTPCDVNLVSLPEDYSYGWLLQIPLAELQENYMRGNLFLFDPTTYQLGWDNSTDEYENCKSISSEKIWNKLQQELASWVVGLYSADVYLLFYMSSSGKWRYGIYPCPIQIQ